jgi:hypothetical protein
VYKVTLTSTSHSAIAKRFLLMSPCHPCHRYITSTVMLQTSPNTRTKASQSTPNTIIKSSQSSGNPLNKPRRRLKDQHMEMLNRPHALQLAPVPEPDNILLPANPRESLPHKPFNLGPARGHQIIGQRIRRKREFGPDDKVHDPRVEAVGPVVAEDLPVFCTRWRRC